MPNLKTGTICFLATFLLLSPALTQALTVDELVGNWDMSYDMGQGVQTGTITISKDSDGSPVITMTTQGGGSSSASDVAIEDEEITWSREINVQGQTIGVDYKAQLLDGQLQGTFELDLGGFGGGGPTSWTASPQ